MNLRHPLATSHTSGARATRSKGVALAVLATAQLVIALDYSIVNVALPDIGRSLGFSGGTVQWVISAYALTFGGFLLLGGQAADLLGRRRMFMVALGLFGVASLAGELTRHGGLLIACFATDDWRSHSPDFTGERFRRNLQVVERLEQFARERAIALPELAVAWTLAHPAVQVAIVGARRPAQLDGTAAAPGGRHLSADDLRRIEVIVADAVPV